MTPSAMLFSQPFLVKWLLSDYENVFGIFLEQILDKDSRGKSHKNVSTGRLYGPQAQEYSAALSILHQNQCHKEWGQTEFVAIPVLSK